MIQISVARALVELKTLDKRIEKAVERLQPVGLLIGQKPESSIQSRKDFEASARSTYQHIQDLIARRRTIKNAVVLSNATTQVDVAGETMTVAEAIERKSSITLDKTLKKHLWSAYTQKMTELEEHNQKVSRQLFQLLQATYAKPESELSPEDHDKIAQPFKANNEASLLDPLKLKETFFALEAKIEAFERDVDIALTESNARTEIQLPQ